MSGPKPEPREQYIERRMIPEPNSGCWLWLGSVNRDGYGLVAGSRKGRTQFLAHRVAWEVLRGAIPAGLRVLHSCDMPCCVNPDHLFLGTQGDNMRDKCAKGRQRNGISLGDKNGSRRHPGRRPRGDNHWMRKRKITQ